MQVMNSQYASTIQLSAPVQKKAGDATNLFSQILGTTEESGSQNNNGIGAIIQSVLTVKDILDLFCSDHAIENEDIESILNELPPEIKELLEEKLDEPIDANDLLNNPGPEMKIVFLLQALYNEQNQLISEPMKKEINILVGKWFPNLKVDPKDSLTRQVKQVIEQVMQQMDAQGKQDKTSFHKAVESLNAEKKLLSFAEQAFQRYVPTKQNDQKGPALKELQNFQSALQPLEQLVLKVPVSAEEGQKQQFAREIQQIISKGKIVVSETGFAKMQIKLNPEHLGTIDIQLIHKQGEITAKIIASSHAAKEALDSHISQLKQAFSGQNIDFEKIEVFIHGEEQAFSFNDQGNQSQEDQNQHGNQSKESSDNSHVTFEEQLSQMVLNEKV
ncbi:flagellar hook-length control protein FliK [Bacillus sp. NEB1478]|uniref:flagellar hook-length control protein FliK n=1 Tax=Bacillus sp. NEB1478 TaxID=3073816 RepID=UPI002873308A|nr:flagellar hook-length control protein FliK [Bacillus sp. NEB1478]WNB90400.1 flagellar hook-length control protein FliK [Bacillus sp. NEB1478]